MKESYFYHFFNKNCALKSISLNISLTRHRNHTQLHTTTTTACTHLLPLTQPTSMTGHRVAALHSFSVPSKVSVHRFPFLVIILTIIPAAHSTLYCDAEGLMYSDEQQSQIDALLMSQMFHTDGATAVKAHPTQGYLYIPGMCWFCGPRSTTAAHSIMWLI